MSRRRKILCGVPEEHCTGAKIITDQMLPSKTPKAHASSGEAFDCMARHLVGDLGFVRMGGREFRPPEGGSIRVLTKRTRYGGHLRAGKLGERYQPDLNPGSRGTIIG